MVKILKVRIVHFVFLKSIKYKMILFFYGSEFRRGVHEKNKNERDGGDTSTLVIRKAL